MQQLIIHIPDNKIAFFMDLAENLGFAVEKSEQNAVLSNQQIELVNEARKDIKDNPDRFIDWDKARKKLLID